MTFKPMKNYPKILSSIDKKFEKALTKFVGIGFSQPLAEMDNHNRISNISWQP